MTAANTRSGGDQDHATGPQPEGEMALPVCIVSRYDGVPCGICKDTINVGDRMFPYTLPSCKQGKEKLHWAHRGCYEHYPGNAPPPPPPPCRHWTRLGRCPSLNAGVCAFRHDECDRLSASSKSADSTNAKRMWGGKRRLVRNAHKNTVFRSFLMQTYSLDYLRKGVVLDVAGGKGELSWELVNLMGVDSVVVDPRPLSLKSVVNKWKRGLFEPKRTGPVFSKWYPACEDGCRHRMPERPMHLRCFFDAQKFAELSNEMNDTNGNEDSDDWKEVEKWFESELARARRVKWTTRGLQHEGGERYADEDDNDESDATGSQDNILGLEVTDTLAAREVLQKCSLVVGFHPDQAAGDIAAYATGRGIPWCIVPCCVYSDLFTKRRLKDGSIVRSYEQLVQWLCESYPEAKVATLDLEGKNKVVYTLPI